ncbi:TPA: ATP-dependent DNA ligase [Methanosarcina acetivorans]|uniref:DNA ligase 2 n=3 Tax=root TaxID=1 RepID=DNLI2_METAC|nr:ATP-dependent DNA ligase [Methanosarcina acetivorans]Q8TMT1.1 RecName: Full=DNA ligase 2; AltName: Full=Polydeoxyribonucleotide synthase [ATP] 2 [Methanosarcina acetivorans C2A]AAM05952.1 DNA ligase (ATP) [Methanosarcina acetivorans C2A]HIH92880.1 ATP-dependent DNA ligase [Methanosarcina acetivorans]
MTSFREFAETCQAIEKISSTIETTNKVADLLKKVDVEELPLATHFIMSEVFPAWSGEQLGIGTSLLYSSLSKASGMSVRSIESLIRTTGDIGETALLILKEKRKNQVTFSSFLEEQPELSITEVYQRFKTASEASGKGSQELKIKNLQFLFNSSTPREAKYISRLALEELRIGVGEGVVRDAIARAFSVPSDKVEHAFMVTNDLGIVAAAAKEGGIEALESLGIEINRPIKMMLSQISPDIDADIRDMKGAAIEWKFDGARVQIHKNGNSVTLFSRKLENVTNSLPDLVEIIRKHVKAESAILDGEAVAVDENGKPRAFQEILKRFRRKYDVEEKALGIPIQLNLFDIMYLNGRTLIDLPLVERRKALESCVESSVEDSKSISVDEQVITGDLELVEKIYREALNAGHEGVMVKNPNSAYSPGKRGKNWLKKKPLMETLDLVVVGAEWGYGRRANLIGSYSVACYDPETSRFLQVGKVGTGLTDEQLKELTEMLSGLMEGGEAGGVFAIRPKVVLEIAFEEIQKSPNYDSGFALRFPRFIRIRDDKDPEEADTIQRIGRVYSQQLKRL